MNLRYAHSSLARAFAGAAIAACIATGVSSAFAKTCSFPFPTPFKLECRQGSSAATVVHTLEQLQGGLKYRLLVDMIGGTVGAVAHGIDVNGNHLNRCETTVADENPVPRLQTAVACSRLYGTSGTAQPQAQYNYPVDMASTTVTVL